MLLYLLLNPPPLHYCSQHHPLSLLLRGKVYNKKRNCVFGAGKGTRTLKLARRNLNPVCLPISSYPHIQFFTSGGTGRTFTEVTAPKSNVSANSTTPAYSVARGARSRPGRRTPHRGYFTTREKGCQREIRPQPRCILSLCKPIIQIM